MLHVCGVCACAHAVHMSVCGVAQVSFQGEHAAGLGGPYRQFFSDVFAELQERGAGATLSLFVPSPNAQMVCSLCPHTASVLLPCTCGCVIDLTRVNVRCCVRTCVRVCHQQVGQNRDKVVLRPSNSSASSLAQYVFLGRLIGAALRTGVLVKLDLPSFVFKPLVGQPVTTRDLELVDSVTAQLLQALSGEGGKEEELPDLTFSTMLSDKTVVELVPGGASVPVTKDNVRHCPPSPRVAVAHAPYPALP